jgi:hypothetical protein
VRGIRLEVIRVGGTLCTSVEALQRFFERLASPLAPSGGTSASGGQDKAQFIDRLATPQHSASPETPPSARQRRLEAVDQQLDAEGLG